MRLFDIKQYELPQKEHIDWQLTKHNVGIFLSAYKSARERVGQPTLPKLSMEYSLINQEYSFVVNKEELNGHEEHRKEFLYLNDLFVIGYSSIMHPYRPEVTERRRKIFMLRYLHGLPGSLISERINYQKNIIIEDSKKAMIQFATPLALIAYEKQTLSNQIEGKIPP